VRRTAVWLVTVPIALSGIEGAHAVANAVFGAPAGDSGEIFASAATGASLVPLLVAVALAAVGIGLAGRIAGRWLTPRNGRMLALPFAFLPPAGFVLLELAEAALGDEGLQAGIVSPAVLLGLVLQLPFAFAGYLVARGLLRLGDEVRAIVVRPRVRLVAAVSNPLFSRPSDDARRATPLRFSGFGRGPPVTGASG
jgi:hypothetical protein